MPLSATAIHKITSEMVNRDNIPRYFLCLLYVVRASRLYFAVVSLLFYFSQHFLMAARSTSVFKHTSKFMKALNATDTCVAAGQKL